MIGRYAEPSGFRRLLRSRDLLRVAGAGALIAAGAALARLLPGTALALHGLPLPGGAFPDGLPWVHAFPLAALALAGGPIVWGAARGVARGRINVDELVAIAIAATVALGEFESAAIVAFIMSLGQLVEEITSDRARRAIEAILRERPSAALVVRDGVTRETPVDRVCPGETVRVRPGDVFPLDGEVVGGTTSADESTLTGEALPVPKREGDAVFAGTLNLEGCADVRVRCAACDGTLARIARLVEEAERHRAPVLRTAERYARWFTPGILAVAAAVWILTGDPLRAVTVLIVGCPCAFVLATPTAVVAALGRAAREGVLVKGGRFLEAAGRVDTLAFDKTGTLTEGLPEVALVWTARGAAEEEVLRAAAGAEAGSEHPLGKAVVEAARARGVAFESRAGEMVSTPGLGVRAGDVRVGSARYLEEQGVEPGAEARAFALRSQEEGRTALFVARGGSVLGGLAMRDRVRVEAPAVAAWARRSGLRTLLLTGDQEAPARAVAAAVGVGEARAALLPGDKLAAIRGLQEEGRTVAYVGDGTNDGPALAQAELGVSLASRCNTVALETAHAVLMEGGLRRLPFLIELGRRTVRVIHWNLLVFGLFLNAGMLTLSALGFLTPILAALAHNAGSVAVVLNSARLLRAPGVPPLPEATRPAPAERRIG